MGITERREAEKEILRAKIFDGASRLIIEEGYEKFSIRNLAKEIEYSPAMIYNYFKDKDDIIMAITIHNYDRIYRELSCVEFKSMSPKTALKTGLLKFSYLILKFREHFRATLLSGVNNTDRMSDDNRGMDLLINILNRGISSGDFIIENTEFTAFLLITGVFGVMNMIVLNKLYDENIITETINGYVEILVKGVIK
jgi:AcrR family transcriptional regulator